MDYQEKAFGIIKKSIKSAVFIDENARSFYSQTDKTEAYEEKLSESLFNKFKDEGISLAVHRYKIGDEDDPKMKNYLLESRDLVLLDWNLDGHEGYEFSLKLIEEIVKKPNIHFCSIYTSDPKLDSVFDKISCYFCGKTKTELDGIRDHFEAFEDDLKPLLDSYDVYDANAYKPLIGKLNEIDKTILKIVRSQTGEGDLGEAIKLLVFAFRKSFKSKTNLPKPTICSQENKVLVIGNTILTILEKDKNEDSEADASALIRRLSTQLAQNENSFTQLLGFEMQCLFLQDSSFVDANLLKVSKDALLAHRKQIVEKDGNDIPFKVLIKKLLIEHASLSLRNAKLSLLDEDFLDDETKSVSSKPTKDDLFSMNVFYNSVRIKNSIDGNIKSLNFGDVFNSGNRYFICITALCDCFLPHKIKNNYYFSLGQEIPVEKALQMGDSGFISYLPNGKVVSWVLPESIDDAPTELVEETEKDSPEVIELKKELYKVEFEKNQYQNFIHKPAYIKPFQLHVTNHKMIDDKIEVTRIETEEKKEADFGFKELTYITSIRPDYAQRIANHAFSHPLRVGVDFVKSNQKLVSLRNLFL